MRVPLDISPGLVSDETPYSVPGTWKDGNNVRPHNGRMEVIGGWEAATASTLTGVCRNVMSWVDNSGIPNIAFGTHSALMVLKDEALADITPTGIGTGNIDSTNAVGYGTGGYGMGTYGGGLTEYYPRTWSLETWGEYLLASPRGYSIYEWNNDTASVATEVADAPDTIMHMLVTPQRQVLAFGCEEAVSGDFNWLCIRGSDIRDYTNWTITTSNNAFEYILESSGKIIAAQMFGNYVAVWTETSVHLGTFQTDNTQTPWTFDLVADNCGLAGPNAVVVVNQVAYWLTPDLQFYAWQLGTPPRPINCPISRDFETNVDTDQLDKVVATSVSAFTEVWWFYPDARDGDENSRYVALSIPGGQWFRGDVARTAVMDSGTEIYPIFVDYDGNVFYHEKGNDANGSALSWDLTSSDIYIREGETRGMVRGIWPDFKDQQGDITMTLYFKDYPQATGRTKGPWTLGENREKRDLRAEGRLMSMKYAGSSVGAFMRIGKPSIDVVETGAR